jgi:hypothetical protein
MINQGLLYASSALIMFWGAAHFFPTKSIVMGFGSISSDNRRIITMEWIIEGVTLNFIGAIIVAATFIDHAAAVSKAIYWLCFIVLNVLSVVSLMTGFKVSFLPFKLCPVIFTTASILILLGNYL